MTITHAKVSAIPDGADTGLVRPSDWNSDHIVTGLFGWINVRDYGAIGDGTTDDTAAIAAAIAAIPAGGGTLFFPTGTYNTTGGFTIAVPCAIRGEGMAAEANGESAGSLTRLTRIECNSRTAVLFTVTAAMAKFEDIALVNTASLVPTAGAGIRVTSALIAQRVDYDAVYVQGFYDCIAIEVGASWAMRACHIYSPVRYGVRIQNTVFADAGDWSISDCLIQSSKRAATSAIRIDSGSGGKIINCKINSYASPYLFATGIDINFDGAGIGSGVFLIANCSIENLSGSGITVTAANSAGIHNVIITGVEISLLGSNTTGHGIVLTGTGATLDTVTINGCILRGDAAAGAAIVLTSVNTIRIDACTKAGFTSLYSQTGSGVIVSDSDLVVSDEVRSASANYTVSSTTFVVLDAALELTITLARASRLLIGWVVCARNNTAAKAMGVDVLINGTTYLNSMYTNIGYGSVIASDAGANAFQNMSAVVLSDAFAIGTHTFNLVFAVEGGTATVYGTNAIVPIRLWVQEIR